MQTTAPSSFNLNLAVGISLCKLQLFAALSLQVLWPQWGTGSGVTCPAVSSLSCSVLSATSREDLAHSHAFSDVLGSPAVCGASPSRVVGGCWDASTFGDAAEVCASFGSRLCTLDELMNNEVTGTGCGFDSEWEPSAIALASFFLKKCSYSLSCFSMCCCSNTISHGCHASMYDFNRRQ